MPRGELEVDFGDSEIGKGANPGFLVRCAVRWSSGVCARK